MRNATAACLLLAACAASTGCGRWETAEGWDGGAARAVARQVEAAHEEGRIVVLSTLGDATGEDLPWGVRQSLTTAGFELGDSAAVADPDVILLIFEESRRAGADWHVHTRTLRQDAQPLRLTWTVRCDDDSCTVVESVPRTTGP
jgi:hypothetical protein